MRQVVLKNLKWFMWSVASCLVNNSQAYKPRESSLPGKKPLQGPNGPIPYTIGYAPWDRSYWERFNELVVEGKAIYVPWRKWPSWIWGSLLERTFNKIHSKSDWIPQEAYVWGETKKDGDSTVKKGYILRIWDKRSDYID